MASVGNARAAIGVGAAAVALMAIGVVALRAEPKSEGKRDVLPDFPTDGPFHYQVEYLGITCGHMTLESRLETYQGRPAYHVLMTASNSKFFNRIYRVDGRIESWVDAESMSTIAYESDITEKGRRKISTYRVDTVRGVVRAEKNGKETSLTYDGEPALDPMAYVYKGRVLAGIPGSTFKLNLLTDHGVIATETRVTAIESFATPDGRRPLLRLQPATVDGEMFSRKGEFVYWIAPDAGRRLYRLDFKLSFGRLVAKYTGSAERSVDRRTPEEGAASPRDGPDDAG